MSDSEKNLADVLVDHILTADFQKLTKGDIQWAKKVILDYFGVCLIGHTLHECQTVTEEVTGWSGEGRYGIHFRNKNCIQPFSALINGTLARAADLDDVYEDGFLQVYGHILPPLFAAAESLEECSGKDFMVALNVGADINCRLAKANNEPCTVSGRYNLFKIFGAVAAVAKLLNFNEEQIRNALGISYGLAHGELQGLREGAFSCLLSSGGFNALNTMLSILFAKSGIHGTRDIFEGQYGFFKAFEVDVNKDQIIDDIGKDFYGKRSSIKLYPSSRATHAGIDAALELRNDPSFNIDDIVKVDLQMFDFCYNIVGSPIEEKQNPKNCEQAKFSYPFCVACALSGMSMLSLLDEKTLKNKQVADLARKINTRVDKNLKKFQAKVKVHLTSGKVLEKAIFTCKGHPDNPFDYNDIKNKFLNAIEYSKERKLIIKPEIAPFLFDYVENLEEKFDIQNINTYLL